VFATAMLYPTVLDIANQSREQALTTTKTATKSATVSATKDETADWKTFTSPCGFSIKYPKDYNTGAPPESCGSGFHSNGSIVSPDQGRTLLVNISVNTSPKSVNFEDEIASYLGWAKADQESTTILGSTAIKLKPRENQQAGFEGGLSTGILILKDGRFFHFLVIGDESTISIWNDMLSTFKFL